MHDADQFLTSAVWTDAKRLEGEYLVDLGPMDGPDRARRPEPETGMSKVV